LLDLYRVCGRDILEIEVANQGQNKKGVKTEVKQEANEGDAGEKAVRIKRERVGTDVEGGSGNGKIRKTGARKERDVIVLDD
jgi:hypothetical protein